MTLLLRASAPRASAVGICDASSNTAMSKIFTSGCRYCATAAGLIKRQGARVKNRLPHCEIMLLTVTPLILLL